MAVKDFHINKNTGDIEIDNGDFVVSESDQQHIEDILISSKGDYKQSPFSGVGIRDWLKGPSSLSIINDLEKEIRMQLVYDSFSIKTLRMTSFTDIKIDAERIL